MMKLPICHTFACNFKPKCVQTQVCKLGNCTPARRRQVGLHTMSPQPVAPAPHVAAGSFSLRLTPHPPSPFYLLNSITITGHYYRFRLDISLSSPQCTTLSTRPTPIRRQYSQVAATGSPALPADAWHTRRAPPPLRAVRRTSRLTFAHGALSC